MTRPKFPSDLKPRKRSRANVIQVALEAAAVKAIKTMARTCNQSVSAWCAARLREAIK